MEAILRSGKKIHGKLADILVKKGVATPLEFVPEEVIVPEVKKKRKPKAKK